MMKDAKIYVSGHSGMLGGAVMRLLESNGYSNVITRTHQELDLSRQVDVETFFEQEQPEYVFHIAAKTGGVQARLDHPADMLLENVAITLNVLRAAYKCEVKKLLYVASGLVYPSDAPQPLRPESIGLQALDVANEPYALAKILGIRLCQYMKIQYHCNFISCIPCNTYGPTLEKDSQFIPSIIKKFAKETEKVVIWGDGTPTREFLHVSDLADALVFLMEHYECAEPVNIGSNEERTIADIVELLQKISEYKGPVYYDKTKPNGTQRLFMDSSLIKEMGWQPQISLADGLSKEFKQYRDILKSDS